MKNGILFLLAISWSAWWLTPDQQGWRHFQRGEFEEAAAAFQDPLWSGTAWYRAGEFEKAAQQFARRDSAEAYFNQGNSQLLLGKYDAAVSCYDRALQKRAQWPEAIENRAIATARAKALDFEGGDMTGGELGADEIVFDNKAGSSEQTEEVAGNEPLSNQEIQALWLRRVQTKPADFLKAKFAFQQAQRGESQ